MSARYSRGWYNFTTPLTLGDGFDNDGIKSGVTVAQNASLEYTWTINPRIIWNSHVALDRVHELSIPAIPPISSFNASLPSGTQGMPAVFEQANGIDKMPPVQGQLTPQADARQQEAGHTPPPAQPKQAPPRQQRQQPQGRPAQQGGAREASAQ